MDKKDFIACVEYLYIFGWDLLLIYLAQVYIRYFFKCFLGVTYLMAPAESSDAAALLRHFSSSRYLRNFVFLAISADLTLVHFFGNLIFLNKS